MDALRRVRWSSRQPLLVLIGLPLVALAAFLAIRSVSAYREESSTLIRSYGVLNDLVELRSDLRTAESAHRGYMLIRRSRFLGTFNEALRRIRQDLTSLEAFIPPESGDAAQLGMLRGLIDRKIEEMQETLREFDQGKSSIGDLTTRIEQGSRLTAEIEAAIRDLNGGEERRLSQASNEAARSSRNALAVSVAVQLLLMILLGIAALVIQHDNRRRARDQRSIEVLNEALGRELQERTSILESIGDGFCSFNGDGEARYVNAAAERMLGRGRDEVLGKRAADIFQLDPETDRRFNEAQRRPGEPSSTVYGLEFYYAPAERWFNLRQFPSSPDGFTVYFADVTEDKRAEAEKNRLLGEIQEARTLLDTFFENAPVGFAVWNRDLTFMRVNAALGRIVGAPAANHIGRAIEEVLPMAPVELRETVARAVQNGETLSGCEVSAMIPSDTEKLRHWIISLYPILIRGQLIGAGAVWEDITERRTIEASLRQTAKLESLGVLAGGIAHDFNNLLTGILGNASLAMDTLSVNNPARQILTEVVTASERAAHLTRQLLAYAGKGRFTLELIDLSELVREISSLIRTSIPRWVQLRLDLQEKLPCVYADASQMQQLVMNLVINAAEAIPTEEAGTVSITTGSHEIDDNYIRQALAPEVIEPGKYVFLEVHDTGIGMQASTIARIFDPFFTTKFTGRGLGLAAVMGIVRGHKGALKVYSTPGKGSTFKVLLPSTEDERPRQPVSITLEDVSGSATVLVVDDEEIVRRTSQIALERYGYSVIAADNGREGLDLLRALGPTVSLVLLDLTMPVMSGEQTLREMRSLRPDLPVILSSGFNEQEAIQRFSGKNLSGFIQKPYTARKLAEKVKEVLTRVKLDGQGES